MAVTTSVSTTTSGCHHIGTPPAPFWMRAATNSGDLLRVGSRLPASYAAPGQDTRGALGSCPSACLQSAWRPTTLNSTLTFNPQRPSWTSAPPRSSVPWNLRSARRNRWSASREYATQHGEISFGPTVACAPSLHPIPYVLGTHYSVDPGRYGVWYATPVSAFAQTRRKPWPPSRTSAGGQVRGHLGLRFGDRADGLR